MGSNRQYGPAGAPGAPALPINTVGAVAPVLPVKQFVTVATETVINNPSLAAGVPLLVQIPSDSLLEQQPFEISASGYITTAATLTVTLKLYSGISETVGSDILLKASTATSQNSASAPFFIKALCVYDSVSGLLSGTVKFLINGSLTAEAAFTNQPSGVNNQGNPVLSFLLSATFSVANAGNLINVKDFCINF